MVAGAPAALGVGDIVIGHDNTINRNVIILGVLAQLLDTLFHLFLCELSSGGKVVAVCEPQGSQLLQLVGFVLQFVKALQHAKRHKGHAAVPAVLRFEQPD